MNIVADQLASKQNTQAMLVCFLTNMNQFFKKSPTLSQDKTYARILKMAETTQKYLPHYYNQYVAQKQKQMMQLSKIQKKFEDQKQDQKKQKQDIAQHQSNQNQKNINNEDMQLLQTLHSKLSKQKDATKIATISLGREFNQEFMRKLVFDSIDDVKDFQIVNDTDVVEFVRTVCERDSNILVMDSYLCNRTVISKIATEKGINVSYVAKSGADPKKNEINLTDVASRMRKFDRVIISAEVILKNGAVLSETGSFLVALAATKYNVPLVALGRGFCLTEKVMIDQYSLLAENPMKYFKKSETNVLKAHIAKKFDLIEPKFIKQVITEFGIINPSNIELQFSSYYDYC